MDPVLLDTDTLSEVSRGNPRAIANAKTYLRALGAFTISAVTVFERLRGYRLLEVSGRARPDLERQFLALVATSRVVPFDEAVAADAARIWANLPARARANVGDVLIAATATAHGFSLVTRNRKDFLPMTRVPALDLKLLDWTR